jgi:hypothetical protein
MLKTRIQKKNQNNNNYNHNNKCETRNSSCVFIVNKNVNKIKKFLPNHPFLYSCDQVWHPLSKQNSDRCHPLPYVKHLIPCHALYQTVRACLPLSLPTNGEVLVLRPRPILFVCYNALWLLLLHLSLRICYSSHARDASTILMLFHYFFGNPSGTVLEDG